MPGALPVSRVNDDGNTRQSCRDTGVKMRICIVGMDNVKTLFSEQSAHLSDLSKPAGRLQLMYDSPCIANFIGEPTDLANCKKFWQAGCAIMVPGKIGEDSFEPPRLQRQADMADAQRLCRTGNKLFRHRFVFDYGHRQIPFEVTDQAYRDINTVKPYSPANAHALAEYNRNRYPRFQITSGSPDRVWIQTRFR